MNEALPASMIAHLERLGAALCAVKHEHQDAPLRLLEQAVLQVVREHLPLLLQEVLQASVTSLQPPFEGRPQPCPQCGTPSRIHSWRPRTITTVCGPIQFTRPWHVCPTCAHGFSAVDATLQIVPSTRLSAGMHTWLVETGARTSFGEAAALLETLTGVRVSPETVRHHTEQQGQAWEEVCQQEMETVVRTQESPTPVDAAPGMLTVETDGVMVRYRDAWHEVKLGVVGGHVDGKTTAASYVAARTSAAAFGPRLLTEAARRGALEVVQWEGSLTRPGLAVLREVTVLGDGAPWIWNLAAEHFGARTEIVDVYHASEHLWAVAHAAYGETPKARRWAQRQTWRLREKGVAPVLRVLRAAHGATSEMAEVLRRERGYFRTNAARMDYPTYRTRGLPIGSGAVEGSAKHLVQQRMKRPGARWSEDGAQAVLNVRCRLLSDLPLVS